MADLSSYSNEDLVNLYKQSKSPSPAQPAGDLSKLSDNDLINLHKQASSQPAATSQGVGLGRAMGRIKEAGSELFRAPPDLTEEDLYDPANPIPTFRMASQGLLNVATAAGSLMTRPEDVGADKMPSITLPKMGKVQAPGIDPAGFLAAATAAVNPVSMASKEIPRSVAPAKTPAPVGSARNLGYGEAPPPPKPGFLDLVKSEEGVLKPPPSSLKPEVPKSAKDFIEQYGPQGKVGMPELPSAQRLSQVKQALSKYDDIYINPIYDQALKNPTMLNDLNLLRESSDDLGKSFVNYELNLKNNLTKRIDNTIEAIGGRPPKTSVESGQHIADVVSQNYKAQKAQLKPLFEQFKDVNLATPDAVMNMVSHLESEIPGIQKLLISDPKTKRWVAGPYSATYGLSKQEYQAVKDVIDTFNKESLSFKDLQNIREALRKKIDPANPGATPVINDVRKSMLNFMESEAAKRVEMLSPESAVSVRDTFKRWAVNQRSLEDFESILGGKLESMDSLIRANPEEALRRIFRNSGTIETTKKVVGEEEFRGLIGDLLGSMRDKSATIDKGLSTNKFSTQLNKIKPLIQKEMGELAPDIEAMLDLGKLIPDRAPMNPSGSANTAIGLLRGFGEAVASPLETVKKVPGLLEKKAIERSRAKRFEGLLKGEQ